MKIYYDKEKALKNDLFCYGIDLSEEDLKKIGKEYVVYEGETLFSGYPVVEENILRQATAMECVELGYIKLEEGQIVEDNKIVNVPKPENNYSYAYEWKTPEWVLNEEKLPDGVYFDGTEFITVEKPNGVKLVWNREAHTWDETATEEEKKEYCGELVTNILMKVLSEGCRVNIQEKEHIQILDDRKLTLLNSTVASSMLDDKLEKRAMEQILWSFKDDGSDSIILSKTDLYSLAEQCTSFTTACYIVADILKKQQNINITVEDFITELEKKVQTSAFTEVE